MADNIPPPLNPYNLDFSGDRAGSDWVGGQQTPAERRMTAMNMAGSHRMMMDAIRNDPSTSAIARMFPQMMGSPDAPVPPAFQAALGMALNQTGMLGGGNLANTMYGIRSSMHGGSIGYGGGAFSQGIPMQGQAADQMALAMKQNMDAYFRGPGGVMDINRSSGLNMQGLASVSNILQQRGINAGQMMGHQINFNPNDANVTQRAHAYYNPKIKELEAAGRTKEAESLSNRMQEVIKTGGNEYTMDADFGKKANSMIASAAKVVQSARNILGDKSIEELFRSVEMATGMQAHSNNLGAMDSKFNNIVAQAKTMGLDPLGAIQSMGQIGAVLGNSLGSARMGAVSASGIYFNAVAGSEEQKARLEYNAAHGRGGRAFSMEEIAAQRMQTEAILSQDQDTELTAAWLVDNGNLTEEGKRKLAAIPARMGAARDDGERRAISQEANAISLQETGKSIKQLRQVTSASAMREGLSAKGAQSVSDSTNARINGILGTNRMRTALSKHGEASGALFFDSAEENVDFMKTAMGSFDAGNQSKMFDIMKGPDAQKRMAEHIVNNMDAFDSPEAASKFMTQMIAGAKSAGGWDKMGAGIEAFGRMSPVSKFINSKQNQKAVAANTWRQRFDDNALGSDRGGASGFLASVVQGLVGGKQFTGMDTLGLLQSIGKTDDYTLNEDGGMTLDDAQFNKVKGQLGDDLLGYSDEDALRKGLATSEGAAKLASSLEGKGMFVGTSKEGDVRRLSIASEEMKTRAEKSLRSVSAAQSEKVMAGGDPLTADDATKIIDKTMTGGEEVKLKNGLTDMSLKGLDTILSKGSDKEQAAVLTDLKRQAGGKAGLMDAMETKASAAGIAAKSDAEKEAVKAMRDSLEKKILGPESEGAGKTGSMHITGTLKLTDDTATLYGSSS